MSLKWPNFVLEKNSFSEALWRGHLVGVEKEYELIVHYGLPLDPETDPFWRKMPLVMVISPRLRPRPNAEDEAPLPHVYFNRTDITRSPLCLFDPEANEWSHNDLIAQTTIPWSADWLACYECWLATGRWLGGGRHADEIYTPKD